MCHSVTSDQVFIDQKVVKVEKLSPVGRLGVGWAGAAPGEHSFRPPEGGIPGREMG